MAVLPSSPLILLAIGALFVYYASKQVTVWNRRRQMIKQHGCKPPVSYDDNSHSWLPSVYNTKQLKFLQKNGPEHQLLRATHDRFLDVGMTHHSKVSIKIKRRGVVVDITSFFTWT